MVNSSSIINHKEMIALIHFERLSKDHLELVLKWRTSENITKYMSTDIDYDLEKQLSWFNSINKCETSEYFIIKYKNSPIGLNSINDICNRHKHCLGGYYIGDSRFQAKLGGIIPIFTLNYIFEVKKLNKSIANIFTENSKVIEIYKRLGYREVGVFKNHIMKKDKTFDMTFLEFLKSDWETHKIHYLKYLFTIE